MSDAEVEIAEGERFAFGDNWSTFLELVDDERIDAAVASLTSYLGEGTLQGKTFVDAGSGSGLFSLAARRMGASVVSFDFDPQSVGATAEMRRRFSPDDPDWRVEQGSVLDREFLSSLGTFDVVYSWGVLHHTGDMYAALDNVDLLVADGGRLFVAIYNDQGLASHVWTRIKKQYVGSGRIGKFIVLRAAASYFAARRLLVWTLGKIARLLRKGPVKPKVRPRGMDRKRDLVDWVGGYPFEVALPEQIFDLYRPKGYSLIKLTTCRGGLGNNQFVFERQKV